MNTALLGYNREFRARRDRAEFKSLITTPAVGVFSFPANAQVRLVSVAGCAAGTTAATFNGRTITTPLLAAGEYVNVGYVERSTSFTPATGFDVLVRLGLGKYVKVAEGA